jgi:metallophosphoesterase (TIGR00282 family)
MNILFIGDVVAHIGRKGLALALPQLKAKYKPDVVITNVENLAHGRGVTTKTLDEVAALGIDIFTGGNHIYTKELETLDTNHWHLITPANDPRTKPDGGWTIVDVNELHVLAINLYGQVFAKDADGLGSPFHVVDDILERNSKEKFDAIIVDHHAEATSEKVAMGFYLDNRVTAVLGTHTHIPTADERVLPGGTAYVTDVGMCGPIDSVLGVKKEVIIDRFVRGGRMVFDYPEIGVVRCGAMLVTVDKNAKATAIERVDVEVMV